MDVGLQVCIKKMVYGRLGECTAIGDAALPYTTEPMEDARMPFPMER